MLGAIAENMKAVLLLLFVCCACVLACEGEMHMSSHMEMGKRSDPITTDYPWVFSVKPVEESLFPFSFFFFFPFVKERLQ